MLVSPGAGFADFHFGWRCGLPPLNFTPEQCAQRVVAGWPDGYPRAGTAYFRWTWAQVEPVRGQIDFAMIDRAIQSANALGETLSFRVMTVEDELGGLPPWIREPPHSIAGRTVGGARVFWPDYRDDTFLAEHRRLIAALGARYDGHPALDHVDIGTVGCWGEWNTACLDGGGEILSMFGERTREERERTAGAFRAMIDHHTEAFPRTPLVMLGLEGDGNRELMLHATRAGAGWRVDCWGDYGYFGAGWNHMERYYPPMIAAAIAAEPTFATTWQRAPVQLEVCGTMPQWASRGWTANAPNGEVHRAIEWAIEHHASLINGKSTPIPAQYRDAVTRLMRRNGYRLAVASFSHPGSVARGAEARFETRWENLGVAPPYHPRAVTFRLRGAGGTVNLPSGADIRRWRPGEHDVTDRVRVPANLAPGAYAVEVALLDRAGVNPATQPLPPLPLAIEGRDAEGWYRLSSLEVR